MISRLCFHRSGRGGAPTSPGSRNNQVKIELSPTPYLRPNRPSSSTAMRKNAYSGSHAYSPDSHGYLGNSKHVASGRPTSAHPHSRVHSNTLVGLVSSDAGASSSAVKQQQHCGTSPTVQRSLESSGVIVQPLSISSYSKAYLAGGPRGVCAAMVLLRSLKTLKNEAKYTRDRNPRAYITNII
jgi:hypothetical protein